MTVGRHQKENIYLKQEFISYLENKDLAKSTIRQYLFDIEMFFTLIEKEEIQITKADILNHLEHLKNKRKNKNISRARVLNSLNHYFTFLVKNEQIQANPCAFLKIRGTKQKTLFRLYTNEELTQLYDNFYHVFVRNYTYTHTNENQEKQAKLNRERNAVILNILIHQGATTKEIDRIELCDLDLENATLKIRGGKKGKNRILKLEATQIGVLMNYLHNIRPQLLKYHTQENEKLIVAVPPLAKEISNNESIINVFATMKTYLKNIDKHFINFFQIRASVITNWLKVHGLRKTQIMAGHRYITSTESYKINDLGQLTDDINKLHPY